MSKKGIRNAFRREVFDRDGHRCKVCGESKNLDAHHITSRERMPNGGYVKENGIALCDVCHLRAEVGEKVGDRELNPDNLYKLINSSRETALVASRALWKPPVKRQDKEDEPKIDWSGRDQPSRRLSDDKLSPDQAEAIKTIESGKGPFFLTGSAGTGKSFIIEHLRQAPGCVVTATTGIAAQLIRGRTIHSFASIHPIHGVVKSEKAAKRIRGCKTLIIDEISMASDKLLDQVLERFEYSGFHPKLIVVGDFLQLPPVEDKYAFESEFWQYFQRLRLTFNHRQQDKEFIEALNDIRLGKVSPAVQELIDRQRVPELPIDCTQLFALRDSVERMNIIRLNELPGQCYCSNWEVFDYKKQEDIDAGKTRYPQQLRVKVGARVVLLNNEEEGLWVNGSTGKILEVEQSSVRIRLDNGSVINVREHEEEVFNADGKHLFVVRQYPMQLAWALTVHKAQGMTLDNVGIDLSNHFASGMTYVALSRCRTREGLSLVGNLSPVAVNQRALEVCGG